MRLFPFILIIFLSFQLNGQENVNAWANLSMVTKTKSFDETYGMEIEKLVPGILATQLNNTKIEVSGYIIPLTGKTEQSHFMFSKFPQNMCFFCGNAGPESAMQVFTKDEKKLAFTQDKIALTGTLQINHDEASGLLYTLYDAEILNNN